MQKTNFPQNTKQLLLFHLFSLMIRFSCLVMYYAAGLTLNTLFAGISSPVVSVPALAVAGGAVPGRYLFQKFRSRILEEITDLSKQNRLSALKQELAVNDCICLIMAVILTGKGGLVLAAGVLAAWLLRIFGKHTEEFEMVPLLLAAAGSGLLAVSAMKTGRAGLYGVIMFLLTVMDLLRLHRQTRFEERAQEEHDLFTVILLSFAKIMTSSLFVCCVHETNRVLSYRVGLSRTPTVILIFLTAAAAAAVFVCADRKSVSLKAERISSLVTAIVSVLYCFSVNRYLSLLCASGCAAVMALPALLGERTEDTEQESVWHGTVSFLFLTVVTAGSWLLYWGAKASFDQILINVILFMAVCMHTGIHEYTEVEDNGELEFREDPADDLADSDQSDQLPDVRDGQIQSEEE